MVRYSTARDQRARTRHRCQRKRRYASEAQAVTAAKGTRRYTAGVPIGHYECPTCWGWHIGRPPA